jgi:hypothetical protein
MSDPAVSIVVAGVNTPRTLPGWLGRIAPQVAARRAEVLLAIPDGDGEGRAIAARFPFVQVVSVPGAPLTPHLWAAAIARATGDVVAVTISACLPEPGWLEAIVAAHRVPAAGVGGVIENSPTSSLVDRALHLVRYTPYTEQPAGPVPEIAGDNGTYKRAVLDTVRDQIAREGFWEAEFHRVLHARGERLLIDPRIRVTHEGSYSALGFARQRFQHGLQFGRARRSSMTTAARLGRAALSPAVPPLMLLRHLQTLSRRRALDRGAIAAAPLALGFLACWAAGEAVGLLSG